MEKNNTFICWLIVLGIVAFLFNIMLTESVCLSIVAELRACSMWLNMHSHVLHITQTQFN